MASSIPGFLALENRYVIEGVLKFQSAVHVGSGFEGPETDAAFVRGAFERDQPFIPGSSLRGVMRSTLERILKAAKPEAGCVLFVEGSHPACFTVNKKKLEEFNESYANEPAEIREQILVELGLCDICKLFGSPWLASKLLIDDCRIEAPRRPEVRHGVGIDRDTETAKPRIKYDFEALEGGPSFHVQMQLENASHTDLALFGIVLNQMEHVGIHVGGKKSRGLGFCRLDSYSVKYFDATNLIEFLTTGKMAPMPDFRARLDSAIRAYFNGGRDAVTVA